MKSRDGAQQSALWRLGVKSPQNSGLGDEASKAEQFCYLIANVASDFEHILENSMYFGALVRSNPESATEVRFLFVA